jgi:hypothetical protein
MIEVSLWKWLSDIKDMSIKEVKEYAKTHTINPKL